jgi:TRAP-type C4-dicarboxylate transport system permease small subunit
MNNNKGVAIALGAVAALFAFSLVVRFVVLSSYGVSGSWMYFGLPFGGIGLVVLLLRLGLLNFGERSSRPIQRLQEPDGADRSSRPSDYLL